MLHKCYRKCRNALHNSVELCVNKAFKTGVEVGEMAQDLTKVWRCAIIVTKLLSKCFANAKMRNKNVTKRKE